MSDVTTHTIETLANLSFRDLQQVAKTFGLNAQGTRDDLVAKILSAQENGETPTSVPAEAAPEAVAAPAVTIDEGAGVVVEDPAPPAVAETPQPETVSVPVAAPAVTQTAASTPLTLGASAKKTLQRLAASYLSAEGYTAAVEAEVVAAIEKGSQPCVVKGTGNTKFEIKVFPKTFVRSDVTQDIPAGRDGVVMNLARRLADVNLIPFVR